MSNNNAKGLYIELDALLDTRLGTIRRISAELAEQVLLSGTYTKRDVDVFEGVDMEQYKDLYAKRDIETLKHSVMTGAIQLLQYLVSQLLEEGFKQPYHNEVKVFVNTYPYQLDEETASVLGKAVASWMGGIASVELVYISQEDLTPLFCKQSYAMMVVYEYNPWLNLHADKFVETRLENVVMFAPAIYYNHEKPSAEDIEEITAEAAHPLRAIEMQASVIVGLQLIDVGYFSIVSPQ